MEQSLSNIIMVLQLNMFQDFTNIMSPQFLTCVSTLELYVAWEVCNSDKIYPFIVGVAIYMMFLLFLCL